MGFRTTQWDRFRFATPGGFKTPRRKGRKPLWRMGKRERAAAVDALNAELADPHRVEVVLTRPLFNPITGVLMPPGSRLAVRMRTAAIIEQDLAQTGAINGRARPASSSRGAW